MPNSVFTAITFSPVIEFIEKTRKLRDLYGSSFILSYLAESVCLVAKDYLRSDDAVISPALLNVTMGTPDQIVIEGDFPKETAEQAFWSAWGEIMDACRGWICQSCDTWIEPSYQEWIANGQWQQKESRPLPWNRDWHLWKKYAWELFWVQGATIPEALEALAVAERDRNWVGVNWMGESSTLSGADAIAWPGLGLNISPKQRQVKDADNQIREFFQVLNLKIGEAILEDDLLNYRGDLVLRLQDLATRYTIDSDQREHPNHPEHQNFRQDLARSLGEAIIRNREQLTILEITKRLFTLRTVAQTVPNSEQLQQELPNSFKDVNLWKTDQPMGWFRGDGDQAGQYIRKITQGEDAVDQLRHFSHQMRQWGNLLKQKFDQRLGRIIFAGGDDFLGIFYPSNQPIAALDWLYQFKENVWHRGQNNQPDPKPITPSLGFVWAFPQVPQREVLQHCGQAEQSAKTQGRDRLALRVLFNSGNHLEWVCPWRFLPVLQDYGDRTPHNGSNTWAHIFNDVAGLEARHAFQGQDAQGNPVNDRLEVALALFNVYFKRTDSPRGSAWTDLDKAEFDTLMNYQGCNDPAFWQRDGLWNLYDGADPYDPSGSQRLRTGILGDRAAYTQNKHPNGKLDLTQTRQALTSWIINLAKVGFHLCSAI